METTIEKTAPYLPHGVKVISLGTKKVRKLCYALDHEEEITDKIGLSLFLETSHINKLVLRPLSDLIKEIEVKSPIYKKLLTFYQDNIHVDTKEEIKNFIECCTCIETGAGYDSITYLTSLHFDVFGGIKEGWAVDMNTIETLKH